MRRPFRVLHPALPSSMRFVHASVLLIPLMLTAAPPTAMAQAEPPQSNAGEAADTGDGGNYWRLMGSPYTIHYGSDPDHEPVYMIGLERQRSDGWVWGGTYFSNSFGQPSGYVYVGEKVIGFSPIDKLFFQWTAGVMYGYKYPYRDKVPLNYGGFSPGVTASLGWQFTREFSMQAIALGTAGMMFQFAFDLR